MENQNVYQKPVTLKNILKFAVPTIAMSVFMSFYTMVDGLFVSNLIGTNALSAINLTAPVIQLVTAISTMLATGGSAVIMKKMGEQKNEEAKEDFTFLILVNVLAGLVMCGLGYPVMHCVFAGMNLSAEVAGYCVEYLSRYLMFTVSILLMNNFTLYMIAGGKASLSFICSAAGGVLNIVLDYILIAVCDMGISGAAVATGLGYSVTAVVGLFVFSRKKSLLHFKKPVFRFKVLVNASANGCSEMATALVTGVITMMFTALSNGIVSDVLAFSRSFVFMLVMMLALPAIFGVNGIWLATPAAELMALALSAMMFRKYKKRYGYGRSTG
ncbi:MATE family efflux transporter [Lachnospiraceae bacterium 46-15]